MNPFIMQHVNTLMKQATGIDDLIAQILYFRDPSIKRNICKKCFMLLVPGISASVRFKGK